MSSGVGANERCLGSRVWHVVSICHLLLREWRAEVSEKDSVSIRNSNQLVVARARPFSGRSHSAEWNLVDAGALSAGGGSKSETRLV